MTFGDATLAMKQGKKVRLPWWGGYWYIANGTLRIHCADDKDFNAFSEENTEPLYTLTFMSANCWEIVPNEEYREDYDLNNDLTKLYGTNRAANVKKI